MCEPNRKPVLGELLRHLIPLSTRTTCRRTPLMYAHTRSRTHTHTHTHTLEIQTRMHYTHTCMPSHTVSSRIKAHTKPVLRLSCARPTCSPAVLTHTQLCLLLLLHRTGQRDSSWMCVCVGVCFPLHKHTQIQTDCSPVQHHREEVNQ